MARPGESLDVRARWLVAFTQPVTGEGEAVSAPSEWQLGYEGGKVRLQGPASRLC